MNSKLDLALDFLKEGQPFTIGDLRFEVEDYKSFIVIGWSRYLSLANLTKTISIKELSDIKVVFSDLLVDSIDLKKFISGKLIEYRLCFNDGGKASLDICREKEGVIEWVVDLK